MMASDPKSWTTLSKAEKFFIVHIIDKLVKTTNLSIKVKNIEMDLSVEN